MNSEVKPSTLCVSALFTPETKFGEQRIRYNLEKLPIKAIHVDRIVTASSDPAQRAFVGQVNVHLYVGAGPKPHRVNIMNTQCIFVGLPPPSESSSSSSSSVKRCDLSVPTNGLSFDLSQGVFEPRSTCVADSTSLAVAHRECKDWRGESWLCISVGPMDSLVDSLMVYLRLELQSSQ